MENWVLLGTYSSEAEVRVIQSKLESVGIPTHLIGSHSRAAGLIPEMLRLMVQPQDLEKAREILQESSSS